MSFIITNSRFHATTEPNTAPADLRHLESLNEEPSMSTLPAPPPLELAVLKPENKMPFKRPHMSFTVDHNNVFQTTVHTTVTSPPPPPPLLNVSTIVRRQESPARMKKEEHADKRESTVDRLIDVENSDPQQLNPLNRNTIQSSDLCSAFVKLDADAFPLKSHGTISVSTIGLPNSSSSEIVAKQNESSQQIIPQPVVYTNQRKTCSDEEFWRHYGPHNLYDNYNTHYINRTYRVYVGRYGDQVRVFKPIAMARNTESVLCRVLGIYCDQLDDNTAQQVQQEKGLRLKNFIWPLSANKHHENVATIRRLIRENPAPDHLPYVDLPSGVLPAKPFSVRMKRKINEQRKANSLNYLRPSTSKSPPDASLESHDYCGPIVDKNLEILIDDQDEFNEDGFTSLRIDYGEALLEDYEDNGSKAVECNKNLPKMKRANKEEPMDFSLNTVQEIISAEQEMLMLARLAKQTEKELRAVATGLKRFSKKDPNFGDSDETKAKKKRTTTGKGIQPAHCPYCMQLFSATFNAKLHYNGRYKGNGKHISCKKRQEMGDQNLNPIVCIPSCLVCEVQKPKDSP